MEKPANIVTCARCGKTVRKRSNAVNRMTCGTSCANALRKTPEYERAWALVDIRSAEDCWPGLSAETTNGYRAFTRDDGKTDTLHRAIWESVNGRNLVNGEWVLHDCTPTHDNRWCCNPKHLRLGTPADNVADRERKRRSRWRAQFRHFGFPNAS
jgi:hypothetical protein